MARSPGSWSLRPWGRRPKPIWGQKRASSVPLMEDHQGFIWEEASDSGPFNRIGPGRKGCCHSAGTSVVRIFRLLPVL